MFGSGLFRISISDLKSHVKVSDCLSDQCWEGSLTAVCSYREAKQPCRERWPQACRSWTCPFPRSVIFFLIILDLAIPQYCSPSRRYLSSFQFLLSASPTKPVFSTFSPYSYPLGFSPALVNATTSHSGSKLETWACPSHFPNHPRLEYWKRSEFATLKYANMA